MGEREISNLHVVMFPWFATGHMTPFLHISNELASRGHRITFLLPNKALPLLESLNLHPNLISFRPLPVPGVPGLPPSAQTASDIPTSLTPFLASAFDLTRPLVADIIRSTHPDLVFYDFAHWLPDISAPLRIRSICFVVVSAASIALTVFPAGRIATLDHPFTEDELRLPPPGYPSSTVVLRGRREVRSLRFLSMPFGDGITFHERLMTSYRKSDAIAIRTCEEVEGEFCRYLGNQFQKQIFLTGPLLKHNNSDDNNNNNNKWEKWLSQFQPKSVIFCAFGSQVVLEKADLQELVLGLEQTGLPFLATLKPPMGCSCMEEALPEGFAERTRERGAVFGGWVQQPLILTHPSVGFFVTHCGFGSMWESLMMGESQIVLVPWLGDQILNARLLADELKVGVEVQREKNDEDEEDACGKISFTRHSVTKAIQSLVIKMQSNANNNNNNPPQLAHTVYQNHARWRQRLTQHAFMDSYIDNFVNNLHNLAATS